MIAYLLEENRETKRYGESKLIKVAVTSEELAIVWRNDDPEHRNYKKILVADIVTEDELKMILSTRK